MGEKLVLPVLPLDGVAVAPGVVVPIRLGDSDDEACAAIDGAAVAAKASGGASRVLLVPRRDGRYAEVGTIAVIELVVRYPSGDCGAIARGTRHARISARLTGPAGALWVEATVVDIAPTDATRCPYDLRRAALLEWCVRVAR